VIGPVEAPDVESPKVLIGHWIGRHAGMFVRVHFPGDSGIAGWLDALGLNDVGFVAAMVRGPASKRGDGTRLFAAMSQAFG
jgi:hypothetical protein